MTCLITAGSVLAQDSNTWSVYCNTRKYLGQEQGTGQDVQVEARSLARMLGVGCQIEGSKVSVNGTVIPQAQISATAVMVPLLSTAHAIGCRVTMDDTDKRIEVFATRGMVPPDIEKAILAAPTINNGLQMDFIYGIVLDAYHQEHLKIYHPIQTHWTTLDDIHKLGGHDAYGYTSCQLYTLNGHEAGVQQIEIYIPYGMSPEHTLHSMAHEMGHCWQYDNGLAYGDAKYTEGFAEWSAAKVLERLKLQHDIAEMTLNLYKDYRDGYIFYRDLEQQVGFDGVLADMKQRGRKGAPK